MPRFGAHMSVAGGVELAFERGTRVGCEAMQIFTKNANQWIARPLDDGVVERFRKSARDTGIRPLLAHDSYLINLGSSRPPLLRKSRAALEDELQRAEALGLDYLVIHPGAAVGGSEDDCLRRIAESIDDVHGRTTGFHVRILLENTAGQGSVVGHRLEHLARIIDAVDAPERLGVCIDTCHLFAAGYDFRDAAGYAATMKEIARVLGFRRVKAFHLNDCKKDLGCRVDRHEHIGRGFIGEEAFRLLVSDPRFRATPMILDTPKGDDGYGMDIENLTLLRRLAGRKTSARGGRGA